MQKGTRGGKQIRGCEQEEGEGKTWREGIRIEGGGRTGLRINRVGGKMIGRRKTRR